jgi:sortase A
MSSITSKKRNKTRKSKIVGSLLVKLGVFLLCLSGIIFVLTFFPVIKEETKYALKSYPSLKKTTPVDSEFGIVIPKISANSKVVDNVDPYDANAYQKALTKGVAHAQGTAYPGHAGNTFIFAHSSANWFIANRYNSVFYLLYKLEKGDKIEMYYKGKKYLYEVTVKKYVEPSDVSYLSSYPSENTSILTLMTCWPPGTDLKRLIIQAKISK